MGKPSLEINDTTLDEYDISKNILDLFGTINETINNLNLNIIFVEGFMLFHDPFIIRQFDIKIFLRASYDVLKSRRANRGYLTQETFWTDPPNYFDDIVYPCYAKTHGYLFKNDDVEMEMKDHKIQDLGVQSILNNDGVKFEQILEWAGRSIESDLKSLTT